MNASLKKFLVMILCMSALGTSSIYADSTELDITLEEAIEMATSYNNNINLLKLSENQILRGVKDAKDGASLTQYALNKYTEYISLYNNGGPHIQKYKNMDDKEAQTSAFVAQSLMLQNPNMNWEKMQLLEEEVKFVEYRYMFGSEEPKLYDEDRYSKYAKNIELASLQATNLKDKYYNNLESVKSTLKNQVTMVYLQYLDLEESQRSQYQYLKYTKKMYDEAMIKFEKGSISEIEYYKAKELYDTAEINSKVLEINVSNIENNLKWLMGLNLNDKIDLTTNILVDKNYSLVKLDEYIEMAKKSSFEYANKKIDFDYKAKEFEVYDKYVKYMTRDKQKVIEDKNLEEKRLATIDNEIKSNVKYALENIMELKADVSLKEAEYKLNLDKYLQGKTQFDLGLITESSVNGLELSYINSLIALTQSKRSAYNAEMKFELLINNGIVYK